MLLTKRSLLPTIVILALALTFAYSGKTLIRHHYGLDMRPPQCEEKGFGFKGITLATITEFINKVKENDPTKLTSEFQKWMKPILDKVATVTSKVVDGAIGDFTGEELSKMDKFSCDVIPYNKGMKLGVVAVSLKNIPCPTPTDMAGCLMFSRCGTVAVAFNSGVPKCVATATGIGAAVAPFLGALSGVGIAYSHNNQIPLEVSIASYDTAANKFEEKAFTLMGNIFFRIQFSLTGVIFPNDNLKIAGKKLSDIFTVKGEANLIIDYGKTFATIKSQIEQTIAGAKKESLLSELGKSGAETAIEGNAEMGMNLKTLTNEMLPDLTVLKTKLNLVATLGNGNSGIKKGVYLALNCQLPILQNFYDAITDIVGKILGFMGIQLPKKELGISVHLGLSVTDEAIGFRIGGAFGKNNGDLNCLYRFSDKTFSCAALQALFNAVKDGAKWVVSKATAFFKSIGNKFKVAFGDAKKWVITNIVDPISDLFKKGKSKPKGGSCAADEDEIDDRCFKKNPKRNYYKVYLKMQRMKMANKRRRLF